MERSRRRALGVLWLAVGLAAAVAPSGLDPADDPLGTGVAVAMAVGYSLIGLSFLLRRPRAWWVE